VAASPRRLRVLHVVTRYRRGGSEQRVRDFVAALGDHDHIVIVGEDSDADLATTHLGVPVELDSNLVRSPRFEADARAVRTLTARLRRDRPDLVVTHQSKAGVVGRVAARLAGGIPVVHSLSMASFGPGYGRAESTVFRVVERALAPLTARYVVVGADLARRFEVAGVASRKLVIVRSAATIPAPRPDAVPSVSGVPDGRPVVLCLGALEPRKNPLDLVPLLQRVRAQVPDAFLAVAGEGPLSDDLAKAVAEAGLADDVALLGFVKPVEPLLWRADALVLMSNAEGLPQVLIQAAAAGLPFVTYDVDGGREVVALGAIGRVVPLGDVEGAAAGLIRLLQAPASRQRRIDVTSWDPTVIAASYRSVVDDILQETRRAG
jgi:glycosyltransferase involved in cell wall biosynthesis